MDAQDDRKVLQEILGEISGVFDEVMKKEEVKKLPLHDSFQAVSSEISEAIKQGTKELDSLLKDKLREIGLSGKQLQLKKKAFDSALQRWHKNKKSIALLLCLFKWINTILGSLTKLILCLEPVKEFKECLENHIFENHNKFE